MKTGLRYCNKFDYIYYTFIVNTMEFFFNFWSNILKSKRVAVPTQAPSQGFLNVKQKKNKIDHHTTRITNVALNFFVTARSTHRDGDALFRVNMIKSWKSYQLWKTTDQKSRWRIRSEDFVTDLCRLISVAKGQLTITPICHNDTSDVCIIWKESSYVVGIDKERIYVMSVSFSTLGPFSRINA